MHPDALRESSNNGSTTARSAAGTLGAARGAGGLTPRLSSMMSKLSNSILRRPGTAGGGVGSGDNSILGQMQLRH